MRKQLKPVLLSLIAAAGGVGGGALASLPSAAPSSAAISTVQLAHEFAALRVCESGGNYGENTGNGYFGAYQFSPGTWHSLGYRGLPNQAPRITQDWAALRTYVGRGWRPWPGCSHRLDLTG